MSTSRSSLSDAVLKDAIASRASGSHDASELVADVLTALQLTSQGGRWIPRVAWPGQAIAVGFVLLALLAALVGSALVAGGWMNPDRSEDVLIERAFVEPFHGLPPEGTASSLPETGQLLLAFDGRIRSLDSDHHRAWLYADGRLIWKRDLHGSTDGPAFAGTEPTTALIEQRLTTEGVALLRTGVVSAQIRALEVLGSGPRRELPGVTWGRLQVRDGERMVEVQWSDGRLPGRLAQPIAWLPSRAWEDPRIGGFVPSRFAVCLGSMDVERALGSLPEAVTELLPTSISETDLTWTTCQYHVATNTARAIAAALEAAGFEQRSWEEGAASWFRGVAEPGDDLSVTFLPILPHGEIVG